MFIPRDYQETALNGTFDYINNREGNPLIAMPTGSGKAAIVGLIIHRAHTQYPACRSLVLSHTKELLVQDHDELRNIWPDAPAGFFSAGLDKKQPHLPIVFGGIGSVINAIPSIGFRNLVIIDEAHLVSPDGNGNYLTAIRQLKKINPHLKVIGLTATKFRMGQGLLTDGGEIFTDIAVDMTTPEWFQWFISNGYLVPPIPQKTRTQIDTSAVTTSNGEFNLTELQEASDRYEITFAAAQEACHYGQNRRSWITFCSGVQHAEHAAEIFNGMGIDTAFVHSKMSKGDRDKAIADWKAGRVRNITNNGILTTGVNNPMCDMLIGLRATKSPGLWVQIVGRTMRPYPGKTNALILDFAANSKEIGTIDDPRIPKRKGEGNGEIPVKICDHCGVYNHISARFCAGCFEPFDIQVKISTRSDDSELLSSNIPAVQYFDVGNVVYKTHKNFKTGNETIKVSYVCGDKVWNEHLSFNDAEGYAGKKARDWWRQRAGDQFEPPVSCKLALGSIQYLKRPKRVRVWANKQPYPEILAHEF